MLFLDEIKWRKTCGVWEHLFFVLQGIQPSGALPMSYILSPLIFILGKGLVKLPRLGLNLRSTCLTLVRSWDYRCMPSRPAGNTFICLFVCVCVLTRMCDRLNIFSKGMIIFPLFKIWLFCKDFRGYGLVSCSSDRMLF